jgi:flagellar hook assembly protein FlgD
MVDVSPLTAENSLKTFPVPFKDKTSVHFKLAEDSHVIINIYNILGEKISTIFDKKQRKGNWQIEWNGTDSQGNEIAPGIYHIEMKAGNTVMMVKTVKM